MPAASGRSTTSGCARSGRKDLADDQMIESKFGISYEDDCAEFGIDFRRRFTRDRDIEPASSFLFTFRLKGVN